MVRTSRINTGAIIAGMAALAALPLFGGPQTQQRDVILAAHPETLPLLNHYEQTATPADRKELFPFTPLVVVQENARLSDGFTPCMEVELHGTLFYLLKDDRGGLPADASVQFERNVTWIGDTMRVRPGAEISLERWDGGGSRLGPGTLLELLFQARGRSYVHSLDHPSVYGWLETKVARQLARLQERVRAVAVSDSSIEAIVRSKIDETNSVLRQLYRAFNRQTGEGFGVPQWTVNTRSGLLMCELANARVSYDQSTRYLENDIENALLGTGVRVVQSTGSIAVYLP
jgi:hypothetical protein